MTKRLEGKVAAITGAASGIGEATARRFVEEGARVMIGDIQEDAGQALAEELGDAAAFRRCDVTAEADIATLVDDAVATFGHLDIMMNNAGIVGARGPDRPDIPGRIRRHDECPAARNLHRHETCSPGDAASGDWLDHQPVEHRRCAGWTRSSRLRSGQTRCGRSHEERCR